jgi:4,5-DOPA dioxygenase extradiol
MPEPYDWAIKFELEARQMMLDGDFEPLVAYEKLGKAALLCISNPGSLPTAALCDRDPATG